MSGAKDELIHAETCEHEACGDVHCRYCGTDLHQDDDYSLCEGCKDDLIGAEDYRASGGRDQESDSIYGEVS